MFGVRRDDYRSPSKYHQGPFTLSPNRLSIDNIALQGEAVAKGFFNQSSLGYSNITNISLSFEGGLEVPDDEAAQRTISQLFLPGGPTSPEKPLFVPRLDGPSGIRTRPHPVPGSNEGVIDLTQDDETLIIIDSDGDDEVK